MTGKLRSNIRPGALVDIVLKRDQPTGKLTRGHVKRILTNSPSHPHGIKVILEEWAQDGRVKEDLEALTGFAVREKKGGYLWKTALLRFTVRRPICHS